MKNWLLLLSALFIVWLPSATHAQPQPVGKLIDPVNRVAFTMYSDFVLVEDFPTQVSGQRKIIQTVPDPSGQMFRMLPAADPHNFAFFIDWRNNLVQIDRVNGQRIIGVCQCPVPPFPYANLPTATYNGSGIALQNGNLQPLPTELIKPYGITPYGNILITGEQQAQQCYQQAIGANGQVDRQRFMQCMVQNMTGQREQAILNCVRNSHSQQEQVLCLLETLGGPKEQQIARKLTECYQAYGSDYSKYPLCLAGSSVDGDLGRLLACLEQQSRSGQVSFAATAVCYGTSNLRLNPETQIILECAAASGGDPYVFAGCAGGQLVSRELDKCLTDGIGGEHGCFGKNNDIIKALAAVGQALNLNMGPNNDAARLWNSAVHDLTVGPGPNNDAIKVFRNVGNEMERATTNVNREVSRAATNVGRELGKAVPKIRIKL